MVEGGGDAGRHRASQLEGIRRAGAEQTERGGHAAQEPVALGKLGRDGRIEGAGAGEAGQRRRRGELPRLNVIVAVDQLERLSEELDVDEAATAVLHMQAPARLATELALH